MNGMAKGAQEVGLNIHADAVQKQFKAWRKEWKGFFDTRKKLYDAFFEAKLKGETPKMEWDTITEKLDSQYVNALKNEDGYAQSLDAMVGENLPKGPQQDLYMAWRGRVNDMRKSDKVMVAEFRQKIRGMKPEQVKVEYAKHWQARIQNQYALWNEERMGAAAMGGDPVAQQMYAETIQAGKQADLAAIDAGGPPLLPKKTR